MNSKKDLMGVRLIGRIVGTIIAVIVWMLFIDALFNPAHAETMSSDKKETITLPLDKFKALTEFMASQHQQIMEDKVIIEAYKAIEICVRENALDGLATVPCFNILITAIAPTSKKQKNTQEY